ncbi:MAG: NAD-glutamate dehydrogenase domain-containing protein, partial [Alphaproteobacteria bacterium]
MPQRAERLRHDIIDSVAAMVGDKLASREAAAAAEFVQAYYANVAAEDLRDRTPDSLYGAALALWGFGEKRVPGKAKIRIYNPRLENYGWKSSHTVVEIVNDDMPFLVDSVTAELNRRDITVHLVIHPIVRLRRDEEGARLAVLAEGEPGEPAPEGAILESFMHVEVSEQPEAAHDDIRAGLANVLDDVRAAVEDWRPMCAKIDEIAAEIDALGPHLDADEVAEVKAFLEWIRDDHFTFTGMRSYDLVREQGNDYHRPIPGSGLGILRRVSPDSAARHATPLAPAISEFARRKEMVIIAKATTRSTVHRAVPLDFIGLRRFGPDGEVVGEHRILGLFTSMAYNQSPRYIPVMRRKVTRTIARAGFSPTSHDGKALLHILETFPRDELFQASEDELFETSLGILQLQERQRIALFVRRDPFERYVTCLVFVPRDRYDTGLRRRFQGILESAFDGTASAFYTQLSDDPLARIHFIVTTTPGAIPDVAIGDVESSLIEASRSWRDRLEEVLVQEKGEGRGLTLLRRYGDAFPPGYRDRFNAEAAIFDIDETDKVYETGELGINLYRLRESPPGEVRLKIYHAHAPVALSDMLPMLENMGFKVISELPFSVTPEGREAPVWIHELCMQTADGAEIDVAGVKRNLEDCLARAWSGEVEDDLFNALVAAAGLTWREVVVIRACCKFLRQAAIPFSEAYMQRTLLNNPELACRIVELFNTRFDPKRGKRAEGRNEDLKVAIEEALDQVANLDEDRILRRFFNLVLATLRTNYFQRSESGGPKPYLSFKFDSRAIDELPLPKPMYEIFVYGPRLEAVHLRGGKVARGGVRWSDRREDFRTEILGLMKAQTVKNTVIVPVGSKGGFVVKRPPAPELGREALMDEVVACYKMMMRGMLDLTDNLEGDTVVPPPDVVRFDDDDPYLVVAADKGTATFSDIANAIAEEYGFWLDDAFASGGSVGYDHKKMGITARGAWESVKRHFCELGLDTQSQDFTVVGIGDMSGDVFGNGMLLSPHIKLVGAFNHLHVFIDPDPDPNKSLAERKRLFELPRSSWADYKAELISQGGGVFERSAKAIKLTP